LIGGAWGIFGGMFLILPLNNALRMKGFIICFLKLRERPVLRGIRGLFSMACTLSTAMK
jgi:hypothetical protein